MPRTKLIAACDPGVGGGIAWRFTRNEIPTQAQPMPDDIAAICKLVSDLRAAGVAREAELIWYQERILKTTGRRRPESTAVVYGGNGGACEMAAVAHGFRVVNVWPQEWQSAIRTGNKKGREQAAWKRLLRALALKLFPTARVTLATADALLILHYAHMKETGVAERLYL